jgi:DNA-binding response OmpR family regulator
VVDWYARPPRVLVVDDDALVRLMLRDALAQQGFEVLTASSGEEGVRLLLEEFTTLELLVTDLNMPGMRGDALAELVQRGRGNEDLVTALVTGRIPEGLGIRARQLGVDLLLDKAEGLQALAVRLRKAVDLRRRAKVAAALCSAGEEREAWTPEEEEELGRPEGLSFIRLPSPGSIEQAISSLQLQEGER